MNDQDGGEHDDDEGGQDGDHGHLLDGDAADDEALLKRLFVGEHQTIAGFPLADDDAPYSFYLFKLAHFCFSARFDGAKVHFLLTLKRPVTVDKWTEAFFLSRHN